MAAYFSPSTARFYDFAIYGDNMPNDAINIPEATRQELLIAQSEGKLIVSRSDGMPIAIDRPGPTIDQQMASERFLRDIQLKETDAIVQRHRDEVDGGLATTLTVEQYQQVQSYRQELRDWPSQNGFPDASNRPTAPVFLGS